MEVSDQIQLKFHGVDFPIVNMNSHKAWGGSEKNEIELSIIPKVFYPKEHPDYFKIIQEVNLVSEGFFELSILAVGNFELKMQIDKESRKNFINFNAPAIMFPYIRSFITTLSANLGKVTGTLIIPTQIFKGELEVVTNEKA